MAPSALVATALVVLFCLSPASVDAHRKLKLHNRGGLLSKFQPQIHPLILEEEELGGARGSRRELLLLALDPYDAGFVVDRPPPLQIANVSTNPATPLAQQSYVVTVSILGASPGQFVQVTVNGSDGFTFTTLGCTVSDITFPNGAGICQQTVPGSPITGSHDTLTATITSIDGRVVVSKVAKVGPFEPNMDSDSLSKLSGPPK